MLDVASIDLSRTCSGPETDKALEAVVSAFGPFFDDMTQRALKRMFLDFTVAEVRQAIDQLARQTDGRRPYPKDFGSVLEANRRFIRSQQEPPAEPEYASNPVLEDRELRHQMIEAIKAGDHEEIKRLEELLT